MNPKMAIHTMFNRNTTFRQLTLRTGNMRLLAMFLVAMFTLMATSCDSPVDYSTTAPAESRLRIISLSPALTQILVDLGQSEYIVGVGQNDAAAPSHAKVVGTYLDINAEQIVSLDPTLVVTMSGRDGPPARLKELASTHFILVDYPYPQTPTDVGNIIFRDSELHALGAMGGFAAMTPPASGVASTDPTADAPTTPQGQEPQAAAEPVPASLGALLDLLPQAMRLKYTMIMRLGEISKLTAPEGHGKDNPNVLLVIGSGPVMASGPGTVLDQLLILAGGRNAASQTATTAPTFDREKLQTLKPDVVLFFDPKGQPLTAIENDPRLADFRELDIPAVKNNRIVIIDNPMAMLPSSSLDKTAGVMAKAIHPELAEQIDVILKSSMVELGRKNDIEAMPSDSTPSNSLKPGSVGDAGETASPQDAPAVPVSPATPVAPAVDGN